MTSHEIIAQEQIINLKTDLGNKVDKVTNERLINATEISKVGYISITGTINLDTVGGYLNQEVKTTSSPSFTGLTVDTNVFKVDAVNDRIGVGTATPNYPVHFMFPSTKTNTTIFEGYADSGAALGFKAFVGRGSASSPATLQIWDNIMAFQAYSHNGGSGVTNFSGGADMVFMLGSTPVANAPYYKGNIEFKVSDGTNAQTTRLQINGGGTVTILGNSIITNNVTTGTVASTIKGIAGQTGNLSDWKDSSNNILFSVSSIGEALRLKTPSLSKTGNYTILATDHTIWADATSRNQTQTLPSASTVTNQEFFIKKVDSSVNTVTVVGTIDGATNYVIAYQYNYVRVKSNGTNYYIVGEG